MSKNWVIDYEGEGLFLFSTKEEAIDWAVRQEQAHMEILERLDPTTPRPFFPEQMRKLLDIFGAYAGSVRLYEAEEEPKDIDWKERYEMKSTIYVFWNGHAGDTYYFSTKEGAENFRLRYLKEVLEAETITDELLEDMPIETVELDPKFDKRFL